MNTRFKLAALAGLESMSAEEMTTDLQNHIIENVFTGDSELTPDEAVVGQKINQALAEATSDVEESSKLAETYIEQEEKQEQALTDLGEAVAGVEALFEGEFSQTAYNHLMRHAERCAKRAGVELPVKLDGMESMTTASIYLETRNGLEGFMDSVKEASTKAKDVVISVFRYLMELVTGWIGQFSSLSEKIKHAIVKADKATDLKDEIKLGKWDRWLDVANKPVFDTVSLFRLLGVALNVAPVSLVDVVMEQDPNAKTIDLGSVKALTEAITQLPMKKLSPDASKQIESYQFDIANVKVTYTVPHAQNESLDVFKAFGMYSEQNADGKETTTKAIYKDPRNLVTELRSLLKFVENTKNNFEKMHSGLRSERDRLIGVINSGTGGMNKTKLTSALSTKRKIITHTERLIFNLVEAKCDLLKAHI
ncbi:hypothetical protein [Photobacterium phage PDCC-1]|uniref:Uncharacterized protein n=2 Tax=Aphroditevirus TaxID=2560092 RepID=A0A6B9J835_9CAUD|nr:internal head protein [Vibrio phage 2 TSL-2019]YP_009853400.1 internal head protein [Photobacterium phage PDCC-1]QAU04325.1 hypothetical protein [Vibrio phage 2 TSL-2019]QGZ14411.1 hypothetical protein [Photobacterium phage PDCC-1]